jgi:hypothetical protein
MFLLIFDSLLAGSTSMDGVSPSGILVKVGILEKRKEGCTYESLRRINRRDLRP